jgi:hypothetical protein
MKIMTIVDITDGRRTVARGRWIWRRKKFCDLCETAERRRGAAKAKTVLGEAAIVNRSDY